MNIEAITDAMLRIAAERGPEKSLCPTDVARAVSAGPARVAGFDYGQVRQWKSHFSETLERHMASAETFTHWFGRDPAELSGSRLDLRQCKRGTA